MRLDIGSARRFDSHFISDTVEPIDVLRIAQGLFLRFPPGRVGRWAVLRSVGTGIPGECVEASADPVSAAAPGGATWRLAVRTDPDFAMSVAVPGALGLSGDLASLPEPMRRRIAWYVAFNKRWRRFLSDAAVHLLTPAAPIEDRRGWVAFQFQNADRSVSLVFAYQLGDGSDTGTFRLFDLDPGAAYAVRREGPDGGTIERRSGAGLSEDGLSVRLEGGFHAERRAAVFSVRRAPAQQGGSSCLTAER